MSNVEDMLEGYDWASDDVMGRKNAKGAVDLIEARLTGELMALENVGFNYSSQCFLTMVQANIHSFLESDDQVMMVIKHMDEGIAELDNLDSILSSYKIHLNVSLLQDCWRSQLTIYRPPAMIFCTYKAKIVACRFRRRISGPCMMKYRV